MYINFNCIEGDMCSVKESNPLSAHFSWLNVQGSDWNNSVITKCSMKNSNIIEAPIIYSTGPITFFDGNITNCHNGDSGPSGVNVYSINPSKFKTSHFSNLSKQQAILLFYYLFSQENGTITQTVLHNITCTEAAIRATSVSCIIDGCTFIGNSADTYCQEGTKVYILNSKTTSQSFYVEGQSNTGIPYTENCRTSIETPKIAYRKNCLAEISEVPMKKRSRIKIYTVQLIL